MPAFPPARNDREWLLCLPFGSPGGFVIGQTLAQPWGPFCGATKLIAPLWRPRALSSVECSLAYIVEFMFHCNAVWLSGYLAWPPRGTRHTWSQNNRKTVPGECTHGTRASYAQINQPSGHTNGHADAGRVFAKVVANVAQQRARCDDDDCVGRHRNRHSIDTLTPGEHRRSS